MAADYYHAWSQSENYLCEFHFELGRNEGTFSQQKYLMTFW